MRATFVVVIAFGVSVLAAGPDVPSPDGTTALHRAVGVNDVQKTEALIRKPHNIVPNDRYPLSPGIMAMREILGQLRPEPPPEPLPPQRQYEPPSGGRYRRRG